MRDESSAYAGKRKKKKEKRNKYLQIVMNSKIQICRGEVSTSMRKLFKFLKRV